MANIQKEIRAALRDTAKSALRTYLKLLMRIVPFNPTTGTSYIQVFYIPTSRRPAVRGTKPATEIRRYLCYQLLRTRGQWPSGGRNYCRERDDCV